MSTNKALAVTISAEYQSYLNALRDAANATETNAKRMGTSLQKIGGGGNKAMFQNLGYQINDVAAQVASGGNVIQAAGMQVGQFLQMFGPWGAIIGAAVAVGGGLAATLLDTKDAAKEAEKAQKDYASAVEFARRISETSEGTNRRLMEQERQKTIKTLQDAAAIDERTAAELRGHKARRAMELETAKAASQFQVVGPQSEKDQLANAVAESNKALNTETDKQLAALEKQSEARKKLLNDAVNPPKGWDSPGGGFKRDNDALDDYMLSLRQSVELQKLDERERAAREAVIRAENAAQQEQRVLTAAQAAEVRKLALARYDLEKSQKLNKKDSLAEYMGTLHDAVELEKLDTRERAAREAVMKAENAAQQEQKTLTADQAAEVRKLALARYDLEQAHKPQKDDAIEAYIEKLRDSADVMAVENRERAIRQALIEAQNIAMREGTVLTDEQTASITNLAGATYDLKDAQEKQREATAENKKLMHELSNTFESAFEDAIIAGKKFSDVLEGIGEDIAKLILRQAITAPLGNAVQGAMGGADFSGMASSAGSWLNSNVFGGFFAEGGSPPVGKASIVGEDGPELFVPNTRGTIIPNNKLGGMGGDSPVAGAWLSTLFGGGAVEGARATGGAVNAGGSYLVGEKGPEIVKFNSPGTVIPNNRIGGLNGGGTTVVNQTIQISTGVSQTVRAEVLNMLPQIASVTKASLAQDQARKGRSL